MFLLVKENEQLESKHTVTQLCCDALFEETVKVKLDRLILFLKELQLAKNVYSLIICGN